MFFNPSCGLCLYKPNLAERVYEKLHALDPSLRPHGICCRRNPQLPEGAVILNVCPSCDNHWRTRYEGIRTLSLYEYIDRLDAFALPRYDQLTLTIHDSCPVRGRDSFYISVRSLLRKWESPYRKLLLIGTNPCVAAIPFLSTELTRMPFMRLIAAFPSCPVRMSLPIALLV